VPLFSRRARIWKRELPAMVAKIRKRHAKTDSADSRARRSAGDRRGDLGVGQRAAALKKEVKLADKPSVLDSHSSRPRVAPGLEPSTRGLGEHVVVRYLMVDSGWRLLVSPATRSLVDHPLRLVSVALFVALRRLGVTQHPALWSPDFPLAAETFAAAVWPASAAILPHCDMGWLDFGSAAG